MKNVVLVFLITVAQLNATAQPCGLSPADCPDNASIEASQTHSVRLGNGLLSEEIDMQDRIRNVVTEIMQKAAKTLKWATYRA